MEAARAEEEAAEAAQKDAVRRFREIVKRRAYIENLLEGREDHQPTHNLGAPPKGRMSGPTAVRLLLRKYRRPMTFDELYTKAHEECGVVSESKDPRNVFQTMLRRMVDRGEIRQLGGQGSPYELVDK